MTVSAMAIDGRGSRTVAELGMQCNAKEWPDPVEDIKPEGYWIAASGEFNGNLPWQNPDREPLTSLGGPTAFAITKSTCYAIMAPDAVADPAGWFSVPLKSLTVTSSGAQGLFKKRPTSIEISADGWTVRVTDVARLFRPSNRSRAASFQMGQEASLISALRG